MQSRPSETARKICACSNTPFGTLSLSKMIKTPRGSDNNFLVASTKEFLVRLYRVHL